MESRNVTAVVTCFNSGDLLRVALDSIQAQGPINIVLVDDGSDSCICQAVARDYPHLIHVKKSHGGQSSALNSGLENVKTSLVAFLDSDDAWLPGRVQSQLRLLKSSSADGVVGGVKVVWESRGVPETERVFGASRLHGALMAYTDSVRKVGPFNETRLHHGIFDWWSRAIDSGFVLVRDDGPVLLRRIHGENAGLRFRAAQRRDLLHYLREHVKRSGVQ